MAVFDYFVIFAEMRTGSNFLEANISQLDGVICHGEAFNPNFIGGPKRPDILGIDQKMRDSEPRRLLRAIRKDPAGLAGFRYFHDHDPRIFGKVMDDPKCAKIILTRNPIESYVSLRIARSTGQWRLGDAKARKDARVVFDVEQFRTHVDAMQAFQIKLLRRLQISGQSAFYIAYEDLQSVEVLNGLAQFLGVSARLESLDKSTKKQNPSPLSEKVENFAEMKAALAELDPYNLTRTPNFEPRRGPAAPTWVTACKAPLLYMPIRGELDHPVETWLAGLDAKETHHLGRKRSQNDLRDWMRDTPGHRAFTILRHPLVRAHHAFCHRILNTGEGSFPGIRSKLINRYKLPLPETFPDRGYGISEHRAAFAAFLGFVKSNLAEQTTIRVDPAWASQAQTLSGFSEFHMPDRILREEGLQRDLTALANEVGYLSPPEFFPPETNTPFRLTDFYDAKLEERARETYARDYLAFGFSDWA